MAGAVRIYVNRYGVLPGRKAVVFATSDDAWLTARDLAAAGVEVIAVVDPRPAHDALRATVGPVRVIHGTVSQAHGGKALNHVTIRTMSGQVEHLACDLLAVGNGWNPVLHLTSHQNNKPRWNAAIHAFVPDRLPAGMTVAGAAAGEFSLQDALTRGAEAAGDAVENLGMEKPVLPAYQTGEQLLSYQPTWRVSLSKGKAFVDFQNDVTDKDIELASREGFRAVELLKRYTTLGMATDQGKTSNLPGLAIMAELTGRTIPQTGTTVFRPPYTPVALGALGGHHRGKDFRPIRLAPTHEWSKRQGAVFIESGAWLRAQYYPKPGENDWLTTVNREVLATRQSVGICDVSTLGKIDIQGADAAEFLERVYTNSWKNLAVGRARYGVMLREDGMVMDDGTTSRLAENHFVMTTTTANAVKVMQHLEFAHQVMWPMLDVRMVSVSEQWAQASIAGPRARDILRKVIDAEHDLSDASVPYMAAREVSVGGGIAARLFRISFSGELAYELAVPARYGVAMMDALMEAGAEFGITPYGIEALGVMRIEKGHVAGNELNGTTTARDLGLGKMVSSKKDFIGRVMAKRPGLVEPERPSITGFRPVDTTQRLRAGAHFIAVGDEPTTANDQGYMTSVAFSPNLGHWIGLGLLKNGPQRWGETIRAYDPVRGGDILVEICNPVFIDEKGERLHG